MGGRERLVVAEQPSNDELEGGEPTTAGLDWAAVFDAEMLEALVISEEFPAFADEVLDQLADDWCRSQHSPAEIRARQLLAGVSPAPVITFAIPSDQLPFESSRCAA